MPGCLHRSCQAASSPLTLRSVVLGLCSHLERPLEWIACDFCCGELLQVAQEGSGEGTGTEGGVCSTH